MTARWSYALNQWKGGHDQFVTRASHDAAFKIVAVCGFEAVEIETGSGRWDPMGRPEWIERHYGSVDGLRQAMEQCGLSGASSYLFDPGKPVSEEASFGWSVLNRAEHARIVENGMLFARLLPELGGDLLAVRAMPSYAATHCDRETALDLTAECWNALGHRCAEIGVRLALNIDCMSILRTIDDVGDLLDRCDAGSVGLSIDTAEAAIAGIDPVALFEAFADRVWHVQLKNTRFTDELDEYKVPDPDKNMLLSGGKRGIERWYFELGDPHGLVDAEAFYSALQNAAYSGWIIIESDQTPNPATSAMVNAWFVQNKLLK